MGTKIYIVKWCFGLKLNVCFHDPNCREEFDLKRNDSLQKNEQISSDS